ncbi:MAG: P1 family peptidase [Anaerolineae bacterium]|nr:P1 family peptidase [Anaerolineae bacterium]
MSNHTITAIDGIRVGHAHALDGPTGCTVILCPPNTVGGVDQRGGAPGTRETDLLRPLHMVEHVHAVMLAGGSAYGLDAAGGVMRWLEEQGTGFDTGAGIVPIVPAAIIFDLDVGDPAKRPDAAMGYAACQAAVSDPVEEGCVGAGAGARVGGLTGPALACKSGLGSAVIEVGDGLRVGALFVVNALGDVIDEDGAILAGSRMPPDGAQFAGAMNVLPALARMQTGGGTNTVVGVVTTNAQLSKEETNKVAQMAQDGLARAVRPAHTMLDGDTVFALATGSAGPANVSVIGAFAAEAAVQAIRRAVRAAVPMAGLPDGASVSAPGA